MFVSLLAALLVIGLKYTISNIPKDLRAYMPGAYASLPVLEAGARQDVEAMYNRLEAFAEAGEWRLADKQKLGVNQANWQ